MAATEGGPLNVNTISRAAILCYSGSCSSEPGFPTITFVIYHWPNGHVIEYFSSRLGSFVVTGDAAHYRALIAGLQHASWHGIIDITAFGESRLVSNQVNGNSPANGTLGRYKGIVLGLSRRFRSFVAHHILGDIYARTYFLDQNFDGDIKILENCCDLQSTRKYILDHRWDGCERMHYILYVICYYLPDLYQAVEDLGRQIREEMGVTCWGDWNPHEYPGINNNVHCMSCLLAMPIEIN